MDKWRGELRYRKLLDTLPAEAETSVTLITISFISFAGVLFGERSWDDFFKSKIVQYLGSGFSFLWE